MLPLTFFFSLPVWAFNEPVKHSDPIAPVILGVTAMLFFAVLGRFTARKFGQPSVLGELLMGVLIGNIGYWLGVNLIELLRQVPDVFTMVNISLDGRPLEDAAESVLGAKDAPRILEILRGPNGGEYLQVAHVVDVFSRYGVIFLLFLVGLETDASEMRQTGPEALRVAAIGVVVPFALGMVTANILMPDFPLNTDLFISATLCATSVGISAAVLHDLHRSQSREAHIILGAAVLDDILGLVILAIVSGIVVSGRVDFGNIVWVIFLAILFLASAVLLSKYFLRLIIYLLRRLDLIEAKMFVSFLFTMILAWLANLVGLATIIGSFAAGVILSDAYFTHWRDEEKPSKYTIRELITPLEVILVPIFFVLMGIQVKLESFLDWRVVGLAAGLIVVAVLGKLVSGLAAGRGTNRLAVGIGMTPRGEVGLIFASLGKSLGVIDDAVFSAIILMVIVTTLATPPLLKLALRRTPIPQDAGN